MILLEEIYNSILFRISQKKKYEVGFWVLEIQLFLKISNGMSSMLILRRKSSKLRGGRLLLLEGKFVKLKNN